jgi:hypothetical protein
LKIINLSNSLNLIKTPDFTGIPNLENLILEGCTSLSEVHPSLARHKKLQYVNLMDCVSIRIFPSNLEMESLVVHTGLKANTNKTQISRFTWFLKTGYVHGGSRLYIIGGMIQTLYST